MFWEEEKDPDEIVESDIIDLAFSMSCDQLPNDHNYALHRAIVEHLPWFATEERVALHSIHAGDSGNGWERPNEADAMIYPSRRTKLMLRLPEHLVEAAQQLSGRTLDLGVTTIEIGDAKKRPLSRSTAMLARYVIDEFLDQSEERFLHDCVEQLKALDIEFKKILVGRQNSVNLGDRSAVCRSIFVADLGVQDTMRLQELGIGSHQRVGCGVFIPHKTLKKV